MSNKITKKQINHLGKLTNLDLSLEEIEKYSDQLEEIIGYVDQLNEINTDGVEPTYVVNDDITNIFREDKVEESLTQEQALSQAPKTYKGFFVVDGVLYE